MWGELGRKVAGTAVKGLETLHKGLGVINDLGILAAPALLRGKLIVLDDLERKHDKLDIEEILGFIDEYTQRFEARVLLILNTDRLKKRDIWDTLREKVVDQELRLTTYLEAGLFRPSPVLSQLDAFERHGDGLRLAQAIDQLYLTWFWRTWEARR
jgi:hypothetical protein